MDDIRRRLVPDLARLTQAFAAGVTRPLAWRRDQLARLEALCRERETEIARALQEDLHKPDIEALTHESAYVAWHARHARRNLRAWARARRMPVDRFNLPGRAWIQPEPRGPVLILAPWNYPWHLALTPLIGALAAGNTALIKPSELAPATSALLAELVPTYLDRDAVRVIEGDATVAQALLSEPWGLVFFTGSSRVGRKVAEAAGRTLSPVVLELGGKNPTIVASDADIEVAARRIAWGKLLNAGQTCVAPDHLLIERGLVKPFVKAYGASVRRMLRKNPQTSPDYARIVTRAQFDRLAAMLEEGRVAHGGRQDAGDLYIEPTALTHLPEGAAALSEEVFGPILPIVEIDGIDDAIARINAGEKPLAVYLFTSDRRAQKRVIEETSSGSVVLNDVVIHLSSADLPFGGVGASGIGAYHGRAGFDTFSHLKPVLKKTTRLDPSLRYPPYSSRKRRWLGRIL
ncbi:MAG TPA: aldehyde dehydrogenase family protein [Rhodobacteraceae bacterium]|nr:aldehyde dehydrogenase family protein [Paracoccaceae bacterium]